MKVGGVNVGQYSVASAEQYNNAYNGATTLLENKTADDSEYNAAREALSSAYSSLERKVVVDKGLYRIRSANTNEYSNGKLAYVNSENKSHFANTEDGNLKLMTMVIISRIFRLNVIWIQLSGENRFCLLRHRRNTLLKSLMRLQVS